MNDAIMKIGASLPMVMSDPYIVYAKIVTRASEFFGHYHSAEIRRNTCIMRINAIIVTHRWFKASREALAVEIVNRALMKTDACLMVMINPPLSVNKKL